MLRQTLRDRPCTPKASTSVWYFGQSTSVWYAPPFGICPAALKLNYAADANPELGGHGVRGWLQLDSVGGGQGGGAVAPTPALAPSTPPSPTGATDRKVRVLDGWLSVDWPAYDWPAYIGLPLPPHPCWPRLHTPPPISG